MKKLLSAFLVMAITVILWLQLVTIPQLEQEISWVSAQADSIEALPPQIEYLPGKTDTVTIRDTSYVEPEVSPPELTSEASVDSTEDYEAAFNDGFIRGTISATLKDSRVSDLGFRYGLVKPLQSYTRTDTLIQKMYFPKLIETPSRPNNLIFLAGLRAGGNQNSFSMAPEVELITKQRTAYSYSYDLMRKEHWIGVKFPLFGK